MRENFHILVLAAMVVCIVSITFYNSISNDIDPILSNKKIIIIGILGIMVYIYFTILKKSSEDYFQEQKNNRGKFKPVVANTISREQYKKITEETTKQELEKLYKSKEYQDTLKKKGTDTKNWVWQTRKKAKKTVWREGDDSDDLDNLSQMTISDNE